MIDSTPFAIFYATSIIQHRLSSEVEGEGQMKQSFKLALAILVLLLAVAFLGHFLASIA